MTCVFEVIGSAQSCLFHCLMPDNCPMTPLKCFVCVLCVGLTLASVRPTWPLCLAFPGRPSAAGGRRIPRVVLMRFLHERSGRPLGSGRLLSDEQASQIRSLIDKNNPEQLDIHSALWTRRAVAELIRKEFGIDLAERTVGEYLRRWGYTPKKPQRHARKQDPDEVASGWRRPIRQSKNRLRRKTPRSIGVMRQAWRRTTTRAWDIRRRVNRRRWRCPDHTSA